MEKVIVTFNGKTEEATINFAQASAPVVCGLYGIDGTQTADYRHKNWVLAVEMLRAMGADLPSPMDGVSVRDFAEWEAEAESTVCDYDDCDWQTVDAEEVEAE